MAQTFFFYDLETSGVNPRSSRIMQFAGQRTDADLNPIGEPYNILVKLSADILPDPYAVLLTGITPQQTLQDGITEAEFCELFMKEIVQPNTIFVGFNTVRFDDEFMRFLLYRNFYDPYAWQWKDGCSRWDLLDVVRMTRALRPGDIVWPVDPETKAPTNRLELLTAENNLLHEAAHDALSDVHATIAVAKMLRTKQAKLFDYLLSIRQKQKVNEFLKKNKTFVYSSGRFSSDYEKTTVVSTLGPHPTSQSVLVYDVRHDPTPFLGMSVEQLAGAWRYTKDKTVLRLPVKALQFNRVPAIAPLGVLDDASKERLQLDMDEINQHNKLLAAHPDFYDKITATIEYMNAARDTKEVKAVASQAKPVDEQLYDSFIPDEDRNASEKIHNAKPDEIRSFKDIFQDKRLKQLLPLYMARNFPQSLNDDERAAWEKHCQQALISGGAQSRLAQFFSQLQEVSQAKTDSKSQFLIEELRLYGESLVPELEN